MKKIIKLLTLLLIGTFGLIWATNYAYADGTSAKQEVKVTEKIPWANCSDKPDEKTGFYTCTIEWGIGGFYKTIQWILKFFTFITVLAWVLFIVINGIAISMSWVDSGAKEAAKWRITKTIWGLVLLLLSWLILNLVAPWVYQI